MKVYVKGEGNVTLNTSDYVGGGGEGSVYAKGNIAYKIYADPSRCIPEAKFNELNKINDARIIKPERFVFDEKGVTRVGYTMRFVKDTHHLCQLFTRSFRDMKAITPDIIDKLVKSMRQGVQAVHDADVLIVDLNEMNFLVDKSFKEPIFIDVDSYQTPSFKATALMESVRDRHMRVKRNNGKVEYEFDKGTDWFAFGVVTFQLYVGIHPYMGKHASLKTLDDRMTANISVFNKDVRVPKSCYPFDAIPNNWRAWYEAVFDKGERIAPPTGNEKITPAHVVTVTKHAKGNIHYNSVASASNMMFAQEHNGEWTIVTRNDVRTHTGRVLPIKGIPVAVGYTKYGTPVCVWTENDRLKLFNGKTGEEIKLDIIVDSICSFDNRIVVRVHDVVYDLNLSEMTNGDVFASVSELCRVMPLATKLFDGCIIQDVLGSKYVSLLPSVGYNYQLRVNELDGRKVLSAKHDKHVLVTISEKKGEVKRHVFRFDKTYAKYDVRSNGCQASHNANFTVLDTGVCVLMDEDERLEMFSNVLGSTSIKVVDDGSLSSDMRLFRFMGKLAMIKGDDIMSMSMGSP